MTMGKEVNRRYLESPVMIPIVHPKAFDSHGTSFVFSVAHICAPTMIANLPNAYEILLENIRGGYGPVCFADLGQKPQTPLLVFAIET